MANEKFSEFTTATVISGTEKLVGLQSADNAQFPITFFPITKKISLSSAEILALFTTPKVLVAAQGVNTVVQPIAIVIQKNFNSIAYNTNTNLRLATGTIFEKQLANAIGFTQNEIGSYSVSVNASDAAALSKNVDITLKAETGNPLSGNSTIDVYLTYKVINL